MKPYPRYKPTGLAWLPSVPEHWEVVPFKQLFTLGKGLPITKADLVESGTPVVSYGQIHSKTNTGTALSADLLRFVPPETAAAKPTARLRKGDFAFADTSEDVAGCGNCVFNNRDDEVFGGYHTILAFNHRPEHGRYLSYLFQSPCWRDQIRRFANGVKVYSVTGRILNAAMVTLPDSSEQDHIVRYLDEKTAAIDELVRAKEREIELLRERKQALVSAAVTGGLDLATERKDSGVPWIGTIPKEWKIIPLKRIAKLNPNCVLPENGKEQVLVSFAPMECVRFDSLEHREAPLSNLNSSYSCFNEGDIAIAKVTPCFENGNCCIMTNLANGFCFGSSELFCLRPNSMADKRFLLYLFRNAAFINGGCQTMSGTGGLKRVSSEYFRDTPIPLPPLPEQERIVAHLDSACSELDAAEAAIRKQIALLQELRTRLVSDAVTGAVEV